MGARAIWKGTLRIGATKLAVKLYAAVEDRKVRFHLLQGRSKSRVKQQMTGEGGEAVESDEIRKGYEVEPGTFVVLEDEELESLDVEESRDLTALRFVPPSQISNEWYERPYYLGPDGEEETEKYFALVDALEKREVVGVLRWTMRNRTYIGALTTGSGYLLLVRLRFAEEVLPARSLPAPAGPASTEKETRLAAELVAALEGEFEPEAFRDEYRERLQQFIEAKAKGKRMRLPSIKARQPAGSLDAQLSQSLAALKRGKEKKVA